MEIINYRDLYVNYKNGYPLDFVKRFNIVYLEELKEILSCIVDVSIEDLKPLCSLESIEESGDDLRKGIYLCSKTHTDHKSSINKIKSCINDLINRFMNGELNGEDVYNLIEREPAYFPKLGRKFYAFLCSYLEISLRDTNIDVPMWVSDRSYYLSDPYFDETCNSKEEALNNANVNFARRNYYVCL